MLVCKHDGEACVQVPLLPNPRPETGISPNFRINPLRLQSSVSRTIPRIHPRTTKDHLRRIGTLAHTVETRTRNTMATGNRERSIAASGTSATSRLRELLEQDREISTVQVETQKQSLRDVHNFRVQLPKQRVETRKNVRATQYRVVQADTRRLRTDNRYGIEGFSWTLLRVDSGGNQCGCTTEDSIHGWDRRRTLPSAHTLNRGKNQQPAQLSEGRAETRQSATGDGTQTERLRKQGESSTAGSTNTSTNQRSKARPVTQAKYSTDPRKPNGDDRRFIGTQHGTEPLFSEVDLGCGLVRVQATTGIQSAMVRARSRSNRPLVSQQQNVFRMRTHCGSAATKYPSMGMSRLFSNTRQGCQCSKGNKSRGAHGFSLRRRCKTFPLLEWEGNSR